MLIEAGHTVVFDDFDPTTWEPEMAPDYPVRLCLSDRWDIHCWLDYQDWLWARNLFWCHTYGSGAYRGAVIERPDHIYARRSVMIPG